MSEDEDTPGRGKGKAEREREVAGPEAEEAEPLLGGKGEGMGGVPEGAGEGRAEATPEEVKRTLTALRKTGEELRKKAGRVMLLLAKHPDLPHSGERGLLTNASLSLESSNQRAALSPSLFSHAAPCES